MDFSTRYRFDYREHTPFLVIQDANCSIKGLSLTETGSQAPLLALEAIEAHGMRLDLQAREFVAPDILARNGTLSASVDKDGLFNWQKLDRRRKSTEVAAQNPAASASLRRPWSLKAEALKVQDVAVHFQDRSRANPLTLAVGGLNIDLSASAEVGPHTAKAVVDDLEVLLNRASLSEPGGDTPFLTLDAVSLNDGRIDIGNHSIAIARVGSTGGETSLVRGKDGRIRLAELLDPRDRGRVKRDLEEATDEAREEGNPWSFSLGTFEMNGFQMALQDRTFDPAIVYDLANVHVSLKNLTNDGTTPIDFETSLKIGQGGSANVSGQVSQGGDRAEARAKIADVNLEPLRPALTRFTILTLESGKVSASAGIKYRAAESSKSDPRLRVNGSMTVDHFVLNEEGTGERFLEWRNLSAGGIVFDLSPRRLHVEEIRLQEPGAKVVIFKDRRMNFSQVLKRPNGALEEREAKPERPPAAVSSIDRESLPVNIERIRVEGGVVDFADFGLVLPFATQVTDFSGGVTAISSDPRSRTSVKFEGRVGAYGQTTVEGRISPFAPTEFTDITVLFRNIAMQPLSPYSATFAGRKIASGSLNLKLEYKIHNNELLGDHKVVLKRFTLGERVEAPDAIRLPLDLAIALLTDTEGKIDVEVPVRGNVDDPKFRYGKVIRKAIVNLITKIVTSPFRALGSLMGGKGEPVNAVAFAPGSDRLPPPEREKIEKVAEALRNRPRLKLVVQGRFDPEVDGVALRTLGARRALAERMGMKLAPKEDPGPIAFDKAKTQEALEKLLKDRNGKDAVAAFEKQYESNTGRKVKRVKPYLAAFGRGSSDTAFYQAMFEELVKLEPMPDSDLQDLAQRRARAIVEEVRKTGGFGASRVAAGTPGPVEKGSAETVETRLTLDVVTPPSS